MSDKDVLMVPHISGAAYVVGSNVDTDQIIPAERLVYSLVKPDERCLYGRYAMSGLPDGAKGLPYGDRPFTEPGRNDSEYAIMIGGPNFGCGSSREHAPFAIREAGCRVVIAESYARIFYRNSVDGGFLIPFEGPTGFSQQIKTGDRLHLDTEAAILTNETTGDEFKLKPLGEVEAILRAGGVFAYARELALNA